MGCHGTDNASVGHHGNALITAFCHLPEHRFGAPDHIPGAFPARIGQILLHKGLLRLEIPVLHRDVPVFHAFHMAKGYLPQLGPYDMLYIPVEIGCLSRFHGPQQIAGIHHLYIFMKQALS